jgi:hypothetical protein
MIVTIRNIAHNVRNMMFAHGPCDVEVETVVGLETALQLRAPVLIAKRVRRDSDCCGNSADDQGLVERSFSDLLNSSALPPSRQALSPGDGPSGRFAPGRASAPSVPRVLPGIDRRLGIRRQRCNINGHLVRVVTSVLNFT